MRFMTHAASTPKSVRVLGVCLAAVLAVVGCTAIVEAPPEGVAPDSWAALGAGGLQTFTGSVTAWRTRSRSYAITADAAGTLVFDLVWPTTSANLDLRLYNTAGVRVATAATTTAGRETLRYTAKAGEAFNILVRAASGSSSYTLTAKLEASATTTTPSGSSVLVARGSSWRFSDTGADLGTAWRAAAYSDANWRSGVAELGYGDGDEKTLVQYGANSSAKHITTYFRSVFAVADRSKVASLALRVKRDDGCVVYLNGTEVFRSNMPSGTIAASTPASGDAGDESVFQSGVIDPARLVTGSNLFAVEIHQATPDSSDISFDLELTASLSGGQTTDPVPPVEPEPQPSCGDKVCSSTESCATCATDCGVCAPTPGGVNPMGLGGVGGPTGTWAIHFQDEFNTNALDTTKWSTGWFGTGLSQPVQSQETACYDPKNVVLSGGSMNLIAEAKAQTCGGKTRPYTSGAVQTRDKYQFTHGYIEARIYLPGSGSTVYNWPAFWTTDYPYTGEIDVMEGLSGDACAHFHPGGVNLGCGGGSGWHVYAADWSPTGVTVYYDGKKIGGTTLKRSSSDAIIIGNQMSPEGEHGGPVVAPATMSIDYVRVWKRVN
jgi:hypothetical protein